MTSDPTSPEGGELCGRRWNASAAAGPKDLAVGQSDLLTEEADGAVVCLAPKAGGVELGAGGTDPLRQHPALATVVRVAVGVVVVGVGVVGQVGWAGERLVVGALGCRCWKTTMAAS